MIQSGTCAFKIDTTFKLDGKTYTATNKLTFKKAFKNTPVISLSISGWSSALTDAIKDDKTEKATYISLITTFDVKPAKITSSGFEVEFSFRSSSFPVIPITKLLKSPRLFTVTWLAYNEVTIGS